MVLDEAKRGNFKNIANKITQPAAIRIGEIFLNIQIITHREITSTGQVSILIQVSISAMELFLRNLGLRDIIDIFESFDITTVRIMNMVERMTIEIKLLAQDTTRRNMARNIRFKIWKCKRVSSLPIVKILCLIGPHYGVPIIAQSCYATAPPIEDRGLAETNWEKEAMSTNGSLAWMQIASGKVPRSRPLLREGPQKTKDTSK
jgi:hypothetical protein